MADSISLTNGAASLFAGAIMIGILTVIHDKLSPKASDATSGSPDLAQGTTWLDTAFGTLPIIFVLTAILGLVVYSVLNRRTAR